MWTRTPQPANTAAKAGAGITPKKRRRIRLIPRIPLPQARRPVPQPRPAQLLSLQRPQRRPRRTLPLRLIRRLTPLTSRVTVVVDADENSISNRYRRSNRSTPAFVLSRDQIASRRSRTTRTIGFRAQSVGRGRNMACSAPIILNDTTRVGIVLTTRESS